VTEPETSRRPPAWLAELQRDFGAALTAPLLIREGRFRPDPSTNGTGSAVHRWVATPAGPGAVTQTERLEIYQTQYWMRLFVVMQSTFPRLTRLCGAWTFNQLALCHLVENPPANVDLDHAADGFFATIEKALTTPRATGTRESALTQAVRKLPLPPALTKQAVNMDEAQRRTLLAPPPLREAQDRLRRIFDRDPQRGFQVAFAPAFSLVREDWPLAELPATEIRTPSVVPTKLATPRYWVFFRSPRSTVTQRVPSLLARLLARSRLEPLHRAIAAVEAACTPAQVVDLHERLQTWIGWAIESGWWIGVVPSSGAGTPPAPRDDGHPRA